MSLVKIGVIGFGTVGAAVVKAIKQKAKLIAQQTGRRVEIKKVVDKDLRSQRLVKLKKGVLSSQVNDILDDPEIEIVIELIGAVKPAREFIKKAIKNGKHVITANKALLAMHGEELFKLATKAGVELRFEASVGGGIPIIKALRESISVNQIDYILGIVNGTTNYILTQMTKKHLSFKEALTDAQAKGYAEANPRLDISGIDSQHKLAILAMLAFGKKVSLDNIYVEGIQNITPIDLEYANDLECVVKLLAIAKVSNGELEVRVQPTLLPKEHLLSNVNGVFNAVHLKGDMAGQLLFYGQGAGGGPAASAVLGDLVDVVNVIKAGNSSAAPIINYQKRVKKIRKMGSSKSPYYIRFMTIDRPGMLSRISGTLGKKNISIKSVIQKERHSAQAVPIVMITHEAREVDLQKALKEIKKINGIKQSVVIRVEK